LLLTTRLRKACRWPSIKQGQCQNKEDVSYQEHRGFMTEKQAGGKKVFTLPVKKPLPLGLPNYKKREDLLRRKGIGKPSIIGR
jgi:hypothetical protein